MTIKPSPLLVHCPLCQASYAQTAVRLLGTSGPSQLFHCFCGACGHSVMAIVLENSGWVSSVGVVTDLEIADALRFQSAQPITTDECIQFHQALNEGSQKICAYLVGREG